MNPIRAAAVWLRKLTKNLMETNNNRTIDRGRAIERDFLQIPVETAELKRGEVAPLGSRREFTARMGKFLPHWRR
jgi:hypothetical protein